VPISIASDPAQSETLDHTIRAVGRVTRVLEQLERGDRLGLRGPFGQGWPMREAEGRDLVFVTGGLGCAPVVAAISYALARRDRYRRIVILQGVKHAADMIWRERYDAWARLPDTQVRLAADEPTKGWTGHVGLVTELLDQVQLDPELALAMVCGPEPMMLASARRLVELGVAPARIRLSLERDFQCGVGHCGHCQMGPYFVCRDGPVFSYDRIGWLLGAHGF
jgi:sulfhydrogenase subunit gamma (sulfur reductase)